MTHGRASGLARMMVMGLLLAGVAGCYQHTFTIGDGAPAAPVVDEEWHHHWLWGLISPDNELRLRDECSSGNATIEAEESFLNGLVAVLTGGIYSPTTVRVRCAGGMASLDLAPAELARVVSAPQFLAWVRVAKPQDLERVSRSRDDLLAD